MTVVIGHRWAAWHKLENTLSSFQAALDIWVDMIETDVWKIHDGSLVIFHDSLIDRIAQQSWYIYDFTSDDLKTIVLNNQEHILTLDAFLEWVQDKQVQIYFEIKQSDTAEEIYQKIHAILPDNKYTVGSFFHHEIHILKNNHPSLTTGLLFEWSFDAIETYLDGSNADVIGIWFESCDDVLVNAINKAGKKVVFWTIDSDADIKKSLLYKPRWIVSNFPDRVKNIIISQE